MQHLNGLNERTNASIRPYVERPFLACSPVFIVYIHRVRKTRVWSWLGLGLPKTNGHTPRLTLELYDEKEMEG